MFNNLERFESFMPETIPDSIDDLDKRLKIFSDEKLAIWFSPLGRPKSNSELQILGITPGWTQMKIAYEYAVNAISKGNNLNYAMNMKKPKIAFAGAMRKNLVTMLDELGLAEIFSMKSSSELFGSKYLQTGSVLKFPVFKEGKNYTGHSPSPEKHDVLRHMLSTILVKDLNESPNSLIIPLGKSVEEALRYLAKKGFLDISRVVSGFPHPSGANGHRVKQFEAGKVAFKEKIFNWFEYASKNQGQALLKRGRN